MGLGLTDVWEPVGVVGMVLGKDPGSAAVQGPKGLLPTSDFC